MPPNRWRQPRERYAEAYRRAHEDWDHERIGRYERAGFGDPRGYRGAYAMRPAYAAPRGWTRPPEPEGSGWPHPHWTLPADAAPRHLRALADRELARAVDYALYNAIGAEADGLSVLAEDAQITLAGTVSSRRAARDAIGSAQGVPGVGGVRSILRIRGR